MSAVTGVPPVHDLLLGLAGRVDDDLLAWARELLAVGEDDQAVELATAAVAAERVVLPSTLRAALVAAARAAHIDLDVDRALPPGSTEATMAHRFDVTAGSGDAVAAALTALPARRLAGCTVHLTWRRTPAGGAPGPVPHPVVLVEVDPERSAEVLAYVLATELERAGAPASVEVFTTGAPLPGYHTVALRNAHTLVRRQPAEGPEDDGRATAGEGPPADEHRHVDDHRPVDEHRPVGEHQSDGEHRLVDDHRPADEHRSVGERGEVDGGPDAEPEREGDGEAVDLPVRPSVRPELEAPGDRVDRRDGVDPPSAPLFLVPALGPTEAPDAPAPDEWSSDEPRLNGSSAGTGSPAGRRRRAEPTLPDAVGPGTPSEAAGAGAPPDAAGPGTSLEDVPRPAPVRPIERAPDTDPFRGPLRTPLLAPLLDPTGSDQPVFDPPDLPRREARGSADEPAPATPSPEPGGGELPAEWEEDWRSGEWAMPREPRSEHLEHASDERRDGPIDVFGEPDEPDEPDEHEPGAAPSPGTASPDGPSPYERIAEFPRRFPARAPRAGGYGEAAARGSGHVPLFDPSAARPDPTPYPSGSRRMSDAGGESPAAEQAPVPPLPKRSKDGPRTPFGRTDDPLFGPLDRDRLLFDDTFHGRPEPSLFGDALAQERRVPDGPPPGDAPARADRDPGEEPSADGAGGPEPGGWTPRPGRRRRPDDVAADLPPSSVPQSSVPQSSVSPSSVPQSSVPPSSMAPSSMARTPGPNPTGPTPPGTAPVEPRLPEPRPDVPRPDVPRPDVPRPDVPRPEAPRPDAPWSGPPSSPDFEASRLLGGTERDLLSQLQAELTTPQRRPRPYRRAGRPGPTGTVNGHGHSPQPDGERPPPDMAG